MTNKIKIEKGIPIPRGRGFSQVGNFPFEKLRIGESFLIPKVTTYHVANLLNKARRTLKVKFVSRTTTRGVMVWRKA